MTSLFALGLVASPVAYVIIGLIAVLLFGNRLPSIARSLGSSAVEFKRGLREVEKEVDDLKDTVNKAV